MVKEYGINRPISEALTGRFGSHLLDTTNWTRQEEVDLAKQLAFREGQNAGQEADINWFDGFRKEDCDNYPRDAEVARRNALSWLEIDSSGCCGHITSRFNHNIPRDEVEAQWKKGYRESVEPNPELFKEDYKALMKRLCGVDINGKKRRKNS